MSRRVFGFGVWIVDYVKDIEQFPVRNELVNICDEVNSGGGGCFNVLMDLAGLQNNIDLYAVGKWGGDSRGTFLAQELHKRNVDTSLVKTIDNFNTSYTIVLSEVDTGIRSFLFHETGIDDDYVISDFNDLLSFVKPDDIFYIGYINFISGMVQNLDLYKSLLSKLVEKGVRIVVDCVSLNKDNSFVPLLNMAMPYISILLVNEIELGLFTCETYRNDEILDYEKLELGIKKVKEQYNNTLIVHFPEGAYISLDAELYFAPSFNIDKKDIKGAVGAGDGFCAGIINAILDRKAPQEILQEAHAMAFFMLQDKTTVGRIVSAEELRNFVKSQNN